MNICRLEKIDHHDQLIQTCLWRILLNIATSGFRSESIVSLGLYEGRIASSGSKSFCCHYLRLGLVFYCIHLCFFDGKPLESYLWVGLVLWTHYREDRLKEKNSQRPAESNPGCQFMTPLLDCLRHNHCPNLTRFLLAQDTAQYLQL